MNITHNLGKMATEAGIYQYLWRTPEETDIYTAKELIIPLKRGLEMMKKKPEYFRQFEAKNGWGSYDDFVSLVETYIQACEEYPWAEIVASR